MSKENQENFGFGKPKYVYLDKFNRYVVKTDTMLQNLESAQMKQTDEIRKLQKRIRILDRNIKIGFWLFTGLVVIYLFL